MRCYRGDDRQTWSSSVSKRPPCEVKTETIAARSEAGPGQPLVGRTIEPVSPEIDDISGLTCKSLMQCHRCVVADPVRRIESSRLGRASEATPASGPGIAAVD